MPRQEPFSVRMRVAGALRVEVRYSVRSGANASCGAGVRFDGSGGTWKVAIYNFTANRVSERIRMGDSRGCSRRNSVCNSDPTPPASQGECNRACSNCRTAAAVTERNPPPSSGNGFGRNLQSCINSDDRYCKIGYNRLMEKQSGISGASGIVFAR